MEKACIKTFKVVHNGLPDRYYDMNYTKVFETQFCPLQLVEENNPQYINPEYGKYPYWHDELYDKENLQIRQDDYPPTDDEDDPEKKDNKLSRALIELWQTNSEANRTGRSRRTSKTRSISDSKQPLRRKDLLSLSSHKGGRTSIYYHHNWNNVPSKEPQSWTCCMVASIFPISLCN